MQIKTLSICLRLCAGLFLSSLAATSAHAISGGSGTVADPYRIEAKDYDLDGGYYSASTSVQFTNFITIHLGVSATGNHLTIASADSDVSVWAYIFQIGTNEGSSGELHVSGENASFEPQMLMVGNKGEGKLVVENGASVTGYSTFIGGYEGSSGLIRVTGDGSFLSASNFISNGDKGKGILQIDDGALVVCTNCKPNTSNNGVIRLDDGYLAIKGNLTADKTPEEIAAIYHFETKFSAQWRAVPLSKISMTYIKDAAQWRASDLYATYADKIDLTGYTVITNAESDYIWADATPSDKPGWYESSWFGWFCNDETMNGWIFSYTHGYLYIYDNGMENEMVFWDSSAKAFCYTSNTYYPFIYNYTLERLTCYCEGDYPNRIFYDYGREKKVPESECGKK